MPSSPGDLAWLRVYKFRISGQLYLLGCTRDDAVRLLYLEGGFRG